MKDTLLKEEAPDQLQAESGSRAPTCYVSADWILENMWQFPNETWWEATLNGEHRQFVRIRLDIEKQEYVLDAVGIDRKYSESLWRYKGGDWQFLSHNAEATDADRSVR